MKAFLTPLQGLAEFEQIKEKSKTNKGILQVSGCMESQKSHLMYGLSGIAPYRLILAEDERRAREIYEDYRFYDRKVYSYPAKDLLFFQADIHGNLLIRQRMKVIKALLEEKELTVVTSIDGCMDFLESLEKIKEQLIHYESDSTVDTEQLKNQLVALGYERVGQVEMPGQFSVRGGIVDIYCLTEENPWRIELWGDEIDSIRSFDPESQRSLENLEELTIYPAVEHIGDKDMVSFLDYFPEERTIIFLDEPNRLTEKGGAVEEEYRQSRMHREEKGSRNLPENWLCSFEQLQKELNKRNCISVCALEPKQAGWKVREKFYLEVKSISAYNNSFELLVKDLHQYKKQGYRIALLSGSRTRAERLAKDLQEEGLAAFYGQDYDREICPGEIMVVYGHAKKGFEYPLIKFAVMTESDIFGQEQKKKKKKNYSGSRIQDFAELSIGDFVVHEKHGLGIYRGIEKVEVDRIVKDYIKIEYRGGSNLYIPATQLDCLQKYSGADAAKAPKLNKLGTQEWNKTKSKVRGAVKNIAKELVELYAVRQEKEGYVCGPDTVWQREFEEMFPYEETEDQLSAIEDAKRDMESTRIMDRLICGDVGYGKTEVALRAAFKEVQESRQVAYLAPTTILAQQIYNTFVQRMKEFPVRVELLCRFRTPAQQKKAIEDLKKGQVDVIIGTHRILSKDVQFKNLGLLIVDEEQRFGVTHKEKIKQLKKDVDVLTLTATPIPRTLHMSLIGIRDMSVLEEPPMDRMPIQTYVMEYDEETVREAINRELRRGGQVYYVYNRVTDIADVALRIAKLVPDARVDFAHGQMSERELENVMYSFVNGDIDVLVSTTIIETGLDISNVNTMIIHDSDRYGLSQLYQLRGRIGRSNRTAYAFLMYRKNVMLKETAEKRLAAIREYTDLGSGFKIAMRDLELRGAGNLLGAQQHGHMNAVGYDLYCKMLNEAVKEAKGIHTMEDFETSVDLNVDAYIPDSYISNEFQKLDIYKRIAGIETQQDYDDMLEELLDRFGEPGKAVLNLLAIAKLKAIAHQGYVTEIKQIGKTVRFTLYEKARLNTEGFPALMQKYRRGLQFKNEQEPKFILEPQGNLILALTEFAEELKSMAENM
ncbi:transcription-repair coupling factor [Blautia wexlerae]|uniref:transcription-repair coupling factor n=1 Tax=Blautia wexlerae TaxID=418240 RepID=UPI00156DAB94|nr:transcription-repair coupling factor [Blautia wexlerae]MCB5687855.1 transcription-repair coupling factor [Blautia wexlerae]NSD02756.1 transcription-repair coupling factor [Blautia wexlerae]NSE94069.1 transcription-repair coupling factor [Blautia wexlerae]NSF15712.1 transcription-repair coupling factor [Blautia wexlerae]NSF29646.1 transcription-repair coupling factor [Blautia wexlerae]